MFTRNVLIKLILFVMTIAIGVTSGIYFGFAITNRKQKSHMHGPEMSGNLGMPENLLLKFDIGDPFPRIGYSTASTASDDFQNLLIRKKSGVIFSSLGCDACPTHIEQWNQIVSPQLKDNVQEIVLFSTKTMDKLQQVPEYLKNKQICYIDWDSFNSNYNLGFLPISVVVDEEGIVRHIQYGQRGGIDYEILKFLTTLDI